MRRSNVLKKGRTASALSPGKPSRWNDWKSPGRKVLREGQGNIGKTKAEKRLITGKVLFPGFRAPVLVILPRAPGDMSRLPRFILLLSLFLIPFPAIWRQAGAVRGLLFRFWTRFCYRGVSRAQAPARARSCAKSPFRQKSRSRGRAPRFAGFFLRACDTLPDRPFTSVRATAAASIRC